MLEQAGDQLVREIEVDLRDVRRELRALRLAELIPEAQKLLLAVALEERRERVQVGPAQENRYGGRCTPRSVTIALTYSAGVTSKAGL